MKNRNGFVFFMDGSSYRDLHECMFRDFLTMPDVREVIDKRISNPFKNFLLHDKVSKLTNGKFDRFVRDKNEMFLAIKDMYERYDKVYVICTNSAFFYNRYLPGTLMEYKRKWKNLSFVLIFIDIMSAGVSKNAMHLMKRGVFDRVYTIDPEDARKTGATLIWTPYSSFASIQNRDEREEYDLYFCGSLIDRGDKMEEIRTMCEKHGVRLAMDIVINSSDCSQMEPEGGDTHFYTVNKHIPYQTVLDRTRKARCILDLTRDGQHALTIRPYEAVVLGKRLLTDNHEIRCFPYYDPEAMFLLDAMKESDWDKIKMPGSVNYHYRGDFSPLGIIDDLLTNGSATILRHDVK